MAFVADGNGHGSAAQRRRQSKSRKLPEGQFIAPRLDLRCYRRPVRFDVGQGGVLS